MNDAMNFIVLYSNHLLLSFLLLSTLCRCMPFRENLRHSSKHTVASVILLTLPSGLSVPFPLRYGSVFVLLLLFSMLFFEASLFRKCFLAILVFVISLAGLTLTSIGICLLHNQVLHQIIMQQLSPEACRFLPASISCLITYLLLKGIRKIYPLPADSPLFLTAQQTLMVTISICSMGIFLLLFHGMQHTTDRFLLFTFGIIIIALCLLNSITCRILEKGNRENRAAFEETLIRQ